MESTKTKVFRVLLLILSIALIAGACIACVYLVWEKAPENMSEDNVYTFFISGIDEQSYSTEINMLIKMKVDEKAIEIVSFPRDTLLNIDFEIRKLGSVYYGAARNGGDPWKAVSNQLSHILGFDVDAYAFIPKSVFGEFIEDDKIADITTFFSVLNNATETNLKDSNIAYLTRHSVDIPEESVFYYSLPTQPAIIRGYSYEIIRLGDWIAILNTHLNPTDRTITEEDLDIVYLDGETVAATKELLGSWYYDNINQELNEGGNGDE